MASRAELELRAAAAGVEAAKYPNDSNLEQKVIYAEKTITLVAGNKATGTLTSDATAPSNNDTVTIGGVVYTYKTTLIGASFEVLIGASAAVALDNLKSAINATAGSGTTYGTGTTAHPSVTATTNTDTTQVVEALAAGTPGNAITTTENSTHLSWGGATLAGGTAQTGPSAASASQVSGGANL